MPDFTYKTVTCDFSNTLRDQLARNRFFSALGINPFPSANDDKFLAAARAYCLISAHCRNLTGFRDWSPPNMFADKAAIIANAEQFADLVPPDMEILIALMEGINAFISGDNAMTPPEERGTGTDQDFFQNAGSGSPNNSSTSPQRKKGTPPRSPKSRAKSAKNPPSAG